VRLQIGCEKFLVRESDIFVIPATCRFIDMSMNRKADSCLLESAIADSCCRMNREAIPVKTVSSGAKWGSTERVSLWIID